MENTKNKSRLFKNPIFITLAAIFCCALWGSATPFIKLGYQYLMPTKDVPSTLLFAGIRFTMAGILTIVIYSVARRRVLLPKRENLYRIGILSCFQTVLQYLFFYVGLANTTGVKGTIASGSSTFFAIIISALIFRQEKLTAKKMLACVLGFAGIVAVNFSGLFGDGAPIFSMNFLGDGFVIISAIANGFSAVFIRRFSKHEDAVVLSGYQFILGGLVMCAVGAVCGGKLDFSDVRGLLVLLYLAFLSAVAYSLWGVLLKHNNVSKITIFSFTTPVFGVLLTELLLSEDSTVKPLYLIIALVLVCAGILTLNLKIERKQADADGKSPR